MKKSVVVLLISTAIVASCYYDNTEELYQNNPQTCDVSAVSYSQDIQPILNLNCAYSGCHAGTSPAANLDLTTYGAVSANKDNIKTRINSPAGSGLVMPSSGPMSSCNILKVTTWIDQGALEN